MPTVKNIPGPYRFFFFSFDCNEPEHVHVQRENQIRSQIALNLETVLRHGMSIAANVEARIQTASVTEDTITAQLVTAGRSVFRWLVLATLRCNSPAAGNIRDHRQRFRDTLARD